MPSTSWGYRAARPDRCGAGPRPRAGGQKVGDGHRQPARRRGAACRPGPPPLATPRGRWRGSTRSASARACRPRACCSSFGASSRGARSSTPTSAPRPSRWPAASPWTRPTTSPTTSPAADRLLAALAPDLLVFAKLDLWPELATRAGCRRCHRGARGGHREPAAAGSAGPRGPCSAPATRPSRPRAPSPRRTRSGSRASACRRERIRVLGDPRFDSVAARVAAVPPEEPLLRSDAVRRRWWPGPPGRRTRRAPVEAFARVRARRSPRRVSSSCPTSRRWSISRRSTAGPAGAASPHRCASARPTGPSPLLVVDRVGVLAEALRRGDHGVRRRRVRAGGPSLGARAGRVGRAGGIRAQLAEQPGRGPAAAGRRRGGARAGGRE